MEKRNPKNGFYNKCNDTYERGLESAFERIGDLVGKYPLWIMITCILMNFALMLGFIRFESENDAEVLYTPEGSQAFKVRAFLKNVFPGPTENHFQLYQLSDFGKYVEIIFMSRNGTTINSRLFLHEIRKIDNFIQESVSVAFNGSWKYFKDLCAIQDEEYALFGNIVLTGQFEQDFFSGVISSL